MNVKNHCIGRKHLSVAKFRRQNFLKKVALYGSSAYKRSIKKKGEMIL